jgi:hypothetical protein
VDRLVLAGVWRSRPREDPLEAGAGQERKEGYPPEQKNEVSTAGGVLIVASPQL